MDCCGNCINKEICKYKQEVDAKLSAIKVPTFINIKVSCDYNPTSLDMIYLGKHKNEKK